MIVSAILWDIDGVLVDTDLARKRAQTKFLQDCGFNEEEIEKIITSWNRLFWYFEETEYTQILQILQKEFHCEDKLTNEKINWAQDNLSTFDFWGIKMTDGIQNVLAFCDKRSIRLGIVSNGYRSYQLKKLQSTGVDKYFVNNDAIIVKDKFSGKPRPDGIFEVCSVLQIDPTSTVFVGDRITDTIAANLAGCFSINYKQFVPDAKEPPQPIVLELEKPSMQIQSLSELIPFLEEHTS